MTDESLQRGDFIHHKNSSLRAYVREVVFGVQDGMVSTLGAITGIAIGSQDHFTVLLAGAAIIAVESISMGVGSYTSARSEKNIARRMLEEELWEIQKHPKKEETELVGMYVEDGWPEELAQKMASVAAEDEKLMLQEMAYRELELVPGDGDGHSTWINGVAMFCAYIVGGFIPLLPYILLPLSTAIIVSIPVTLVGLFGLGAVTTYFTKHPWYKAGSHMLLFGGLALSAGYIVGMLSKIYF